MTGAAALPLPERMAALGPFFAVAVHDADAPVPAPWRGLAELRDDPRVLRGRVADAHTYLTAGSRRPEAVGDRRAGCVDLRVAASVVHLGISARLVAPALAATVLAGPPAAFDLADLRWQNVPGGAFPLSWPRAYLPPPAPDLAGPRSAGLEQWAAALVDGPLREIVQAAAVYSLSPRLLWGNVASAISGAATALALTAPEHAQRGRDLALLLLNRPELRGGSTGDVGTDSFRRRSCCLIYRAAPTGPRAVCGDCVLRDARSG